MHPVLFNIGSFEVPSFGVMLVIGFFIAILYAQKRAPRFGLTKDNVADSCFWALILGILGARILFILQDLPYYLKNTDELLTLRFAGLTSYGGIIFGFLGFFIWSKRAGQSPLRILDTVAAPFLVAHAIGRIGCLLNGCCYGGHCDLPWGIHIDKLPGLFHPAQIYDTFLTLASLGVLLILERRGLKLGQSIAVTLGLYGLSRFIYEFWRAGTVEQVRLQQATSTYIDGLPITEGQVMSFAFILLGAFLFWTYQRRSKAYEAVPA